MAIKVSSWLKSHSDQISNTYTTDEDGIIGLDDSTDLEHTNAEEEMYKEKYWQLRKQVDEDEICNNLRAENDSLRNDIKELEGELVERENAKLSAEVQLMRREKELNDVKKGANNARDKTLKKNEEYMKFLFLSHGIQTPALLSTSRATPPPTLELTDDDSDMDEADDLSVCPEWYNYRKCSRGGGTRSNKCERGAHPRLINFRTSLKPAFQSG